MPATDTINGLASVQPYFNGVARDFSGIDFEPFGRIELIELADAHEKYFEDQTDPLGGAWPKLEPSTVQRKGHDTILYETGRLGRSLITNNPGGDAIRDIAVVGDVTNVVFGTMVEYSPWLEDPSNNPYGKAWIHVGINDEFLNGFADRLVRYAINEWAATA